jgi:hypothetical protein
MGFKKEKKPKIEKSTGAALGRAKVESAEGKKNG